jgi:hypothetical protein
MVLKYTAKGTRYIDVPYTEIELLEMEAWINAPIVAMYHPGPPQTPPSGNAAQLQASAPSSSRPSTRSTQPGPHHKVDPEEVADV